MISDFSKEKLPPIYKRNGKDCYLDPIREKLIQITPEETIRQQVISYLLDKLEIPHTMIRVEERLSHYGINTKDRADIIVDRYSEEEQAYYPLAIIECKAPGVYIGEKQENQIISYADRLGCDYCLLTNGTYVFPFFYDDKVGHYVEIEDFPKYLQMVKKEYVEIPQIVPRPRLTLREVQEHPDAYVGTDMGESTPVNILIPAVNLWECLLYPDHKFPAKEYRLFRLVEDYGVRILSYGNAAGGAFGGAYRSFIVNYKGNDELVSFGISSYATWAHRDVIKTALNIAIDDNEKSHHALQLSLDDNLIVEGDKCTFTHSGRIGISNIGSGRISELRDLCLKEYPGIVDGKKFNLGTLTCDHLWNLDEPDVMELLENLISYALIRDEYRAQVLKEKK